MKKELLFLVFFSFIFLNLFFISASGKDLNGDNFVNRTDLALLASVYRSSNATFDQNNDGTVNLFDLVIVSKNVSNNSVGGGDVQLTGAGPNVPAGANLIFRLDVTRANQSVLNPTGSFLNSSNWGTQPLRNQSAGDGNVYMRFIWNLGQKENQAGSFEYNLPSTYHNLYVRIVWRMNDAWEWNGGGGKHMYIQNNDAPYVINVASGFAGPGGFGGVPTAAIMNIDADSVDAGSQWLYGDEDVHTPLSDWHDDEFIYTNLNTGLYDGTGKIFTDDVQLQLLDGNSGNNGTAVRFNNGTVNDLMLISAGPWHGGSGSKTQAGDYIDYKLLEVWSFIP